MKQWIKSFLRPCWLPIRCVWCQAMCVDESTLCQACQPYLPILTTCCQQCAAPMPVAVNHCGQCLMQPPAFDCVIAPFIYLSPVDRWIQQIKFHGRLLTLKPLTLALQNSIAQHYQDQPLPTHIIPVPLHRSRLRRRGFNQALEIAKMLARELPCLCVWHYCRRTRATKAQTLLTKSSRQVNLTHAFTINAPTLPAHIAIVDDVLTTGQTAHSLARAFKQRGVERVDVWCLARTPAGNQSSAVL